MTEIRKNLPYSLEVWQDNQESLIGSDIEPVKLVSWDEDILSWDGSRVIDVLTYSFWLVRQNGKPIVIEQIIGNNESWEAYELPKLTKDQIEIIKNYSKEQAIKELLTSLKLNEKIASIKKFIDSLRS